MRSSKKASTPPKMPASTRRLTAASLAGARASRLMLPSRGRAQVRVAMTMRARRSGSILANQYRPGSCSSTGRTIRGQGSSRA